MFDPGYQSEAFVRRIVSEWFEGLRDQFSFVGDLTFEDASEEAQQHAIDTFFDVIQLTARTVLHETIDDLCQGEIFLCEDGSFAFRVVTQERVHADDMSEDRKFDSPSDAENALCAEFPMLTTIAYTDDHHA